MGAASVLSGDKRYEMADDTQVYLWYKGQYYATKLAYVNSDDYYLTGWYDNFGCTAGKKGPRHHRSQERLMPGDYSGPVLAAAAGPAAAVSPPLPFLPPGAGLCANLPGMRGTAGTAPPDAHAAQGK